MEKGTVKISMKDYNELVEFKKNIEIGNIKCKLTQTAQFWGAYVRHDTRTCYEYIPATEEMKHIVDVYNGYLGNYEKNISELKARYLEELKDLDNTSFWNMHTKIRMLISKYML